VRRVSLCLALLTVLALCAPRAQAGYVESDGTIVLQVAMYPSDEGTDAKSIAVRAAIDAFRTHYQRKYNVRVKVIGWQGMKIEGVTMDAPPLLAIAGNVSPDVLYVNFRQSDTYIQSNFLYPLTDHIREFLLPDEQAELDPFAFAKLPQARQDELLLRIPVPMAPVVKRKGPRGQEHIWYLPYTKFIKALALKKDLLADYGVKPGVWVYKDRPKFAAKNGNKTFFQIFAEEGLHPDTWVDKDGKLIDWAATRACRTWEEITPRNWKELFELCCQIQDHEAGVNSMILNDGPQASYSFFNFLWTAGGDAVVQNEKGQWVSVFNDDRAVDSVLFYRLLCRMPFTDLKGKKREGVVLRGTEAYAWERRKLAMRFMYLADEVMAEINPDEVGLAALPRGPTGVSGGELNAWGLGVFSRIGDPRVRKAACEYVWFMGSTEAVRIRTRIYVKQGYAKFVRPALLTKFGLHEYLRDVPKGLQEVYNEALKHGKPEPYGRNCQFVYTEVTKPLEKVVYIPEGEWQALSPQQKRQRTQKILTEGVEETDEKMIGRVKPDVRRFRNIVATIFGIVILAGFIGVFVFVIRTFTLQSGGMAKGGVAGKSRRWAWLLMIPALASIMLWQYVPLVRGMAIAFMDYKIVGESEWVGIRNFADVIFSADFWLAFARSCYYVMISLTLTFLPPIVLAILLQEVPKGKILFRTIYYLPAVTTGLIIMFLWRAMYERTENGMLNRVLMSPNDWPDWAATASKVGLLALVALVIWVLARIPMKMSEQEMPSRSIVAIPLLLAAFVGFYLVLNFIVPGQTIVAVPCKVIMASLLLTGAWRLLRRLLALPEDYVGSRVFWTLPVLALGGFVFWQLGAAVIGHPEGARGFFIGTGKWLGAAWAIKPAKWLGDPDLAMFCCVLPGMWAGMGPGCLIYLAALKSVPDDLYEAADLDGAGFFGKIRHIVFPILKPLILIQFIAAFIHSFRAVQFIFAIAGPGPKQSTNVLGLEIFYNSFMFLRFGIAAAMAWILGALLIGFTVFQLRILSRLQFTTADSQKANK